MVKPVTPKQILDYASHAERERRTLVTRARRSPFTVAVSGDDLLIMPTSSGQERRIGIGELREVCQQFNVTGDYGPANYQSSTFNASYLLALIYSALNG